MNINEQLSMEAISKSKVKHKEDPDAMMFLDILELGIENTVWADYPVKVQERLVELMETILEV